MLSLFAASSKLRSRSLSPFPLLDGACASRAASAVCKAASCVRSAGTASAGTSAMRVGSARRSARSTSATRALQDQEHLAGHGVPRGGLAEDPLLLGGWELRVQRPHP